MKVCFVTTEYPTRYPFGGIATYVRVCARWLTTHGHQAYVICPSRSGPWGTELDGAVMVSMVPPRRIRPRRFLKYASRLPGLGTLWEVYCGWDRIEDSRGVWRAVREQDRRIGFDIIEVADHAGLGWWGLRWPGRPHPIVVRGHFLTNGATQFGEWPGSRFQYWLEQTCARRADLVLTNSEHLARRYRAECDVPESRVRALPLGFDVPNSTLDPVELPDGWYHGPLILFVGWLDPRKGVDVLINAMKRVRARDQDVRLVLVGAVTQRYESRLGGLLSGTQAWAKHLGSLPEDAVVALMQRATVVVLPSRTEPFGRVAVEAQLSGCPVVASRVGGLAEVVVDEETGLLVPPEDVEALADAIFALISSPDRAANMGRCARTKSTERYEISKVMARQVAIYETLVGENHPKNRRTAY